MPLDSKSVERFLLGERSLVGVRWQSVLRSVAFFAGAVLLLWYSPQLGYYGDVDSILEPAVWNAYFTVLPFAMGLLSVVAAYLGWRGEGLVVTWLAVTAPWLAGTLTDPPAGRIVDSFLVNRGFGGQSYPTTFLVRAVPPAVFEAFVYSLPFAVVGYFVGTVLQKIDLDDRRS
ncbi:hypothetical protein ACFO0N_00370 [Halobium salinum]|uniref:Uncharacterized protein n=1 Tax=Halobium salinum TaxID=1364940 RepID=A0ABD5P6X0_9EURY|nr:hypothetical protein [Halobium salinum]